MTGSDHFVVGSSSPQHDEASGVRAWLLLRSGSGWLDSSDRMNLVGSQIAPGKSANRTSPFHQPTCAVSALAGSLRQAMLDTCRNRKCTQLHSGKGSLPDGTRSS